jgi:hypothetical protein
MNLWPSGWTTPVYRKRRGSLRGYVSPLTKRAGVSLKLGPLWITSGGRIYLFGARIR